MQTRLIVHTAAGITAGMALVLACGDDEPANAADAGACTCPAAEAPLAGRITRREQRGELPIYALNWSVGATCGDGQILLGGSCRLERPPTLSDTRGVVFKGFEHLERTYECYWENQNDRAYTIIATAVCLTPATDAP